MRLPGLSLLYGLGVLLSVACLPACAEQGTSAGQENMALGGGIWISQEEIRALPDHGPAWEGMLGHAKKPLKPNLSDQSDPSNVRVLARALVAVRTDSDELREEVVKAISNVQGTERGARTLAIGRELMAYVISAELVGLAGPDKARFESWLRKVSSEEFDGRTLRSTHEERPNNWGTHAGASRLAVALYLGDEKEVLRIAQVFKGFVGEGGTWAGFKFREDWWQPDNVRGSYGINPVGARIESWPVGGVLPDDQRRGGKFSWPPPKENYVYEALQGVVAQAVMLDRAGLPAWEWGEKAVLRAFDWLYEYAEYPAEGDDTWMPPIINKAYARNFALVVPSRPGKAVGFADWTHLPLVP